MSEEDAPMNSPQSQPTIKTTESGVINSQHSSNSSLSSLIRSESGSVNPNNKGGGGGGSDREGGVSVAGTKGAVEYSPQGRYENKVFINSFGLLDFISDINCAHILSYLSLICVKSNVLLRLVGGWGRSSILN